MNAAINNIKMRGALIVFEGCDKCGKTTQSKRIAESLAAEGIKAKYMNFPARESPSGKLINAYLTKAQDLPDECIHLLFTVNRWEVKQEMQKLLSEGTSLIVDRYSYSGVVFSAAKGLNYDWCKSPEVGLLKPDLVFYLSTHLNELMDRSEYGNERYESLDFQKKVENLYERMYKEEGKYWLKVDASRNIDELQTFLTSKINEVIKEVVNKPLELLWKTESSIIKK